MFSTRLMSWGTSEIHKFASKHRIPDAAFNNAFKKVKNCFNVLKLPTTDVERIKNTLRQDNTPCTKQIYFIAIICIITALVANWLYFHKFFEPKSHFRVLPTKCKSVCYMWSNKIVFKSILNKLQYKSTFLESIRTFLVLRLQKLRFKHIEIHTQTLQSTKLLRFSPSI